MTSSPSPSSPGTADARTLAANLAPILVESCEKKLGEITWFRTDWQRGGAATGLSTYQQDDGSAVPVVLKLPVVQREHMWMKRLQNSDDANQVVPRIFASGDELGGYDLAWIVIEKFKHGPLALHWHDDHISRIVEAAARFHQAASKFSIDQVPTSEPWDELLAGSVENIKVNDIPNRPRWSKSLKSFRDKSNQLIEEWNTRDEGQWLHGDLHLANAMSRTSRDEGPVSLIDLAEVHAGHWVEDAVYLERQLWARPERLRTCRPVKALADARKKLGLTVDDDYPRLAMIRRGFLAATAPKFIKSEGHPVFLDACLNRLEIALNELT